MDVVDSSLVQVRRFLQKRRAATAPPTTPFWIGQKGLTDSRRAELKTQVEEYIAVHPVRNQLIKSLAVLSIMMLCRLMLSFCPPVPL